MSINEYDRIEVEKNVVSTPNFEKRKKNPAVRKIPFFFFFAGAVRQDFCPMVYY